MTQTVKTHTRNGQRIGQYNRSGKPKLYRRLTPPSQIEHEKLQREAEIDRLDAEYKRSLPLAERAVLWLRSWRPDYGQE